MDAEALCSISGDVHRRSGRGTPCSERQELGYEESAQPDCCHVTGVGGEEKGEKRRSDDKARGARPPERHSCGKDEDDPAELTQACQDREVVAAHESTVLEEKSIAPIRASCSAPARLFA